MFDEPGALTCPWLADGSLKAQPLPLVPYTGEDGFTLVLAVGPAAADGPHFISEGTASITSSGAYHVVNFKEARPGCSRLSMGRRRYRGGLTGQRPR